MAPNANKLTKGGQIPVHSFQSAERCFGALSEFPKCIFMASHFRENIPHHVVWFVLEIKWQLSHSQSGSDNDI